jgi:signal transduction histidine kinase
MVDRELLLSALANLLQNAFKFTHLRSNVTLRALGANDRVLIEVEDRCGGLPEGVSDTMFLPFTQGGVDKSGLGLGLPICRRIVEANHGTLSVRDLPGVGCVFTIDLPRPAGAKAILVSSDAVQ